MSTTDGSTNGTPGAESTGAELPGLRQRLLDGLLRHAPFDGWSARALAAAARDEGVTREMTAIAFPGGLAEAAEALNGRADLRMTEALVLMGLGTLKIRERITLAVRTRLDQAAGDREAYRALASFLAMPINAGLAARLTWRTVDAMWRAIGDDSTDFAYYTKRATLTAVYGATVLVWLQDSSEGFAETYAFLDRRIADVMRIESAKARFRQARRRQPDPFAIFRRPVSR